MAVSAVMQQMDELFDAESKSATVVVVVDASAAAAAAHRASLDSFIDKEIACRLRGNVTWKHLEACFKWRMVQEYLREHGVDEADPLVGCLMALLQGNKLSRVEYDAKAHRILKLNHGEL
jgi:hypothetical protein